MIMEQDQNDVSVLFYQFMNSLAILQMVQTFNFIIIIIIIIQLLIFIFIQPMLYNLICNPIAL